MEFSTKKGIRLTTVAQFHKLVKCMDEYPHLATGIPQFGSSKAMMEQSWETVAKRVNSYGPPSRSGSEWKKVWADLKCRLKKKIAENNKSLNNTGGGPCRVNNLTELENDIDRICHISAAAAPKGKVYGLPKTATREVPLNVTSPPKNNNIAVVTPTSSAALKVPQSEECFPQQWIVLHESPPRSSQNVASQPYRMSKSMTPTTKPSRTTFQKKRKHCANAAEEQDRLKLLRLQYEVQVETLKTSKMQANATKESVTAIRECSEALLAQSASLKIIAESMKLITKATYDLVKYFTEDQK